ncbi:MAG: TIGR03862 family flavoprotein [Rhodobacteraceae bacterium]|nr:TIGR03862 family flavoprotein [Paracoccaceae bacterium]
MECLNEQAVVIGAGPAGLMAAEALADAGYPPLVIEAKPSPARKLLMAGKSGLNLTRAEPFEDFLAHYDEAADWLAPMLREMSNDGVADWARGLGIDLFTGTTGRVFPTGMKASPLLRAWLARLAGKGVRLATRWRWTGWQGDVLRFETPDGMRLIRAGAPVLALGGASWPRLGSDGSWAEVLAAMGVNVAPFRPANMGFGVEWSPHMAKHFGTPVKACALVAGDRRSRGEFILSRRGLEGGGIYDVARVLGEGAPLALDLVPDLALSQAETRLAAQRGKDSLSNRLRKSLKLDPVRLALLQEWGRPMPDDPAKLARLVKHLAVPLTGPAPIAQAISTAGGIRRADLSDRLMLTAVPGMFAAGEMLDWQAPTGGYLLTACFATGRWAGQGAAAYLADRT